MSNAYDILPYSSDALTNHIALVTNTPFHQLRQKTQIRYLDSYICNYNSSDTDKNLSILIEYNYVERHYLEDYADYFARCHHGYSRMCTRIHLFSIAALTKRYFQEILKSGDDEKINALQKAYIGYIVIRPIPSTVFAKICLKPHEMYLEKLILKKDTVSLYGIDLKLDTVAFQEQDKILSACATSALWCLYNAHNCMNPNNIPSPNAITKEALPADHDRLTGVLGLSTAMICRSMKSNGFSPKYISIDKDSPSYKLLLEHVHAYCSSSIPLIMGVDVLCKRTSGDSVKEDILGEHAITILGYGLKKDDTTNTYIPNDTTINLTAYNIDKLYVHDDRIGPFARLHFNNGEWTIATKREVQEFYAPRSLTFGVYHKIRIPYDSVKKTCITVKNRIIESIKIHTSEEKLQQDLIKEVNEWVWDIKIKKNQALKSEILKSTAELPNREELLTSNFPRYLWSAIAQESGKPLFELLFDATDIPQGNVFLNVIFHDKIGEYFISLIKKACEMFYKNLTNKNHFSGLPRDDYFGGIVNFYLRPKSYEETLNELFGTLSLPKHFKHFELTQDTIKNQKPMLLFSKCDSRGNLDINLCYIWAVNKDGGLLLGHEDKNNLDDTDYNGHITLTQGQPARIAGELMYSDGDWVLNTKSGRYSTDYTRDEKITYLKNVCEQKFRSIFPELKFVCAAPPEN